MSAPPSIASVSFEQHASGRGIGIREPRISWRFSANEHTERDWVQTAYTLEITRNSEPPESHHVLSAESVLVPWPSHPLRSREVAHVRVRANGGSNPQHTEWSEWTTVECGLLKRADWAAKAITSPLQQSEGPLRPLRFRKTFTLPAAAIKHARLYITSLGVFQAYINGISVGDHCMSPGWTSYKHRLNYEVFDVASLLQPSRTNVIAVEVAEGWYATRLGFGGGRRFVYGNEMALIAQLEIDTGNEKRSILTDSTWKCHVSAIVSSEIYDGEVYDAREEQPGWLDNCPMDEASWKSVRETEFPTTELVSPSAPPVRVTQVVKAVNLVKTPLGRIIFDFGQNLVGRLRVPSLNKPANHSVTFTYAEVLERQELCTRPLRKAKCTDTCISAGAEIRDWAPQFTFHGFRFVQVDGWSPEDEIDPLTLDSFVAEVMHSDLERSGWFTCSQPMVNKLHENAIWSMRGNFLSIPTDCPQRDERLGWTGDIQVFAPSACFLYDTAGMLSDWLKDLAAEQLASSNAIPPFVVPNVLPETVWPVFPQALWDDVAILLPWTLYQNYGDTEVLRRQYPSMTTWLDRGIQRGPDRLWDDTLFQLGDWLDPTAPPDRPGDARTDGTLVADAYLVHVTRTLATIAAILNEKADAARYELEFLALKSRFQYKYISPEGYLVGDTQTALSLAIVFELIDSPIQIVNAGARLARLVRKAQFRVSTGFAGTPLITHALTATGHVQLAYRMLQEQSCPSWMYPITMGATTIWERWDSMRPDGSINPGEMTSFNHYALGSIINWLHKTVAGVSPLEPGWRRVLVHPIPGGTVNQAEAIYNTVYGRLECRWKIVWGKFELEVMVPPNSWARVVLPGEGAQGGHWVGSGTWTFETWFDSQIGWPPQELSAPIPGLR
ncbi:putative alpha-L-rhamnosidase [Penicillium oxalicum 114-2]|uniref:alpha-L-rhamnosidase n=1 Tax=Penicillium oxalicum (strain 114-2 / CGMCC 5302) TaxID=933388 RepID=S7ZS15_PENO1|nr:putative alpha-L-rhamnosidase [Penicillium oxalicum 114-2]